MCALIAKYLLGLHFPHTQTAQEVGAFNLNLVERVSQLHGVFVQEMSKSRLYPSDDLVELCAALYRMLEETIELHAATSSSIAAAIKASCEELMSGWDEALTNAFNAGSQEGNSAEMDILPSGHVRLEPELPCPSSPESRAHLVCLCALLLLLCSLPG